MMIEAITIGVILGGCAAAVLFANSRFQSEIERSLARIEAEETIVTRCRSSHSD
jgi:hypothetical protein